MVAKLDRTGEENVNNFGSRMVITRYKKWDDMDVYFPEYDWTAKNIQYGNFKNGNIACPYEKRVYGVGYIGEGKYKVRENGKITKCYEIWHGMLMRCYDYKLHKKYPTYIDCEVTEEWHNYTNFCNWFTNNYYEIEGQRMHLDKDIINKGNKIYSPDNCVFVPERINTLFIKCDKIRGDYPIGVCYHKASGKFNSRCRIYDYKENKSKLIYLGCYESVQKAFEVYKEFKEKHIKNVADYHKDQISDKLYQAMYNYEVNIND